MEGRCKAEQLHLNVKQQLREVDFIPFKPGTAVSIYKFFHKFEAWSRGMMSLDQKANVLYNQHLDPAITDGINPLPSGTLATFFLTAVRLIQHTNGDIGREKTILMT